MYQIPSDCSKPTVSKSSTASLPFMSQLAIDISHPPPPMPGLRGWVRWVVTVILQVQIFILKLCVSINVFMLLKCSVKLRYYKTLLKAWFGLTCLIFSTMSGVLWIRPYPQFIEIGENKHYSTVRLFDWCRAATVPPPPPPPAIQPSNSKMYSNICNCDEQIWNTTNLTLTWRDFWRQL